jgi:hypothetical protein
VNPAPAAIDDSGNPPEATERLPDEIDADTLRKYFTLTRLDLEEVEQCRGAVNKVGFAIQLCTLRWHGYFLPDARNIPSAVIETIASQTGVLPLPIDGYPQNEKTRFEHLERIGRYLGFIRCDAVQRDRLLNHLVGIAQAMPRSGGLRQTAYRWLKQEKIVRPGRNHGSRFNYVRTRGRTAKRLRGSHERISVGASGTDRVLVGHALIVPEAATGR